MTTLWHAECRFQVEQATLDLLRGACSPSGKHVYLAIGRGRSRGGRGREQHGRSQERLRVHTLRGVPGSRIDVLLPDHHPAPYAVCEIGRKAGCYDGAIRWRVTFRSWPTIWEPGHSEYGPDGLHPGPGSIIIEEEPRALILLARWKPAGVWAQSFHQLDYTVEPDSGERVVLWQWTRHYHFLPADEVRQTAAMFASLPAVRQCADIAVLNRMASNALYDLARQMGWRKLSLVEKRRYGLSPDAPQWHRQDGLVLRQARAGLGIPQGVGQYTLDAAQARAIRDIPGLCPECGELTASCACHPRG